MGGENEGEHATAAIAAAPVSKICFWERSTGTKIITAFNVAWANGKESATYGDTHGATKTVLELRYGEFFKEVRLYSTMGQYQVLQWLDRNHQHGQGGQYRLHKRPVLLDAAEAPQWTLCGLRSSYQREGISA